MEVDRMYSKNTEYPSRHSWCNLHQNTQRDHMVQRIGMSMTPSPKVILPANGELKIEDPQAQDIPVIALRFFR